MKREETRIDVLNVMEKTARREAAWQSGQNVKPRRNRGIQRVRKEGMHQKGQRMKS